MISYSKTIRIMDDQTKRMLLFLIGCMGMRSLFVWIAYRYTQFLPYMGALALLPAIGFIVIYLGDFRKTGPEVFGDQIWWNDLRPIHGLLYALFAVLALCKNESAWIVLLVDVLIGFSAYMMNRMWPWYKDKQLIKMK